MNKHIRTPFSCDDLVTARPESGISASFTALLPVLSAYTRAERDLEDIGYSLDPAYQDWHREAEVAQDCLSDILHDLRSAPLGVAVDAPLRKMALLIHAMRCDPDRARALHHRVNAQFETLFRVPGIGAMALHRQTLLAWCRPLVAEFAALPLFDQIDEEPTELPEAAM